MHLSRYICYNSDASKRIIDYPLVLSFAGPIYSIKVEKIKQQIKHFSLVHILIYSHQLDHPVTKDHNLKQMHTIQPKWDT